MALRAVVFDLDGTITEFNLDYREVRKQVCRMLADAGMPASELSLNESTFALIRKTPAALREKGKTAEAIRQVIEKALARVEGRETEAARKTRILPGALEALQELKERGIELGLCTVNGEAATKIVLERFGLNECFDAVVTRDESLNIKPDERHLERVLNLLKVKGEDVAIVGDGVSDMKCAKAVGAVAIGYPTGISTKKELENAGADYIVKGMSELPGLIFKIKKNKKS